MYTLVLMSALSVGAEAPEFGGRLFGRSGSSAGSCYGSCTGTSYACTGCTGCTGCCGGGGFGSRLRAFFSRRNSCYGSCTGRSLACTGCCGGYAMAPVYAAPSCPDCVGSPLAAPAPVDYGFPTAPPPAGGMTLPPQNVPIPVNPGTAVPFAPPAPAGPPPTVGENPNTSFSRTAALVPAGAAGRATVVVRLPADARLYAEGRELALPSAERTFVTPVLPAGEYGYTFRAEYVRDGETISQSRKVTVRPGGTASVEFADLTLARRPALPPVPGRADAPTRTTAAADAPPPAVPTAAPVGGNPFLSGGLTGKPTVPAMPTAASAAPAAPPVTDRARITVRLPDGAALFVDGKRNERTGSVREFSTPPLPAGREFAYLMKAEVLRDGRPESVTQKVTFRAGEIVTVDFTGLPR